MIAIFDKNLFVYFHIKHYRGSRGVEKYKNKLKIFKGNFRILDGDHDSLLTPFTILTRGIVRRAVAEEFYNDYVICTLKFIEILQVQKMFARFLIDF